MELTTATKTATMESMQAQKLAWISAPVNMKDPLARKPSNLRIQDLLDLLAGDATDPVAETKILAFYGPTGCGKLQAAAWLAASLGVGLLRTCAEIVVPDPPSTSANVVDVLRMAGAQSKALYVGDMAEIGKKCRWNLRVLDAMGSLTRPGFVVCSAARPDDVGPAYRDRFDAVVNFGPKRNGGHDGV
jgi:hypothetical protein